MSGERGAMCQGKPLISDHQMATVGDCTHHPRGSIRNYEAIRCRDCGIATHRARVFGCGPRIKEVQATPETCAFLRPVSTAPSDGGAP